MNDLINKAAAPLEGPGFYREAEEALNDFINRRPGDIMNSDEWWVINDMMEWYNGDYLFNNKATLYDNNVDKAAFYITYILKAGLLNSEP
jgi:hypothetical protein